MQPLADKLRPTRYEDIAGQPHLFGEKGTLRRLLGRGYLSNMIFWGPPGTGKTTTADIISAQSGMEMRRLNATTASLSDVREVTAATAGVFGAGGILLYLDEIQYFNKKQQQSLLEFLEDGRVVLIASTTENPYIYIYNALLSRATVFEFKPVPAEDILPVLRRGMAELDSRFGQTLPASEEALMRIAQSGGGDVRRALNILECAYMASEGELTADEAAAFIPGVIGEFDRDGTAHYDLLSALQKSIRGSDPDAAVFYLARILEGGDIYGACRRLRVIASEDIGLAYPLAPAVVAACIESALQVGMPEARIPLTNAALLLATAPKSNSTVAAYDAAKADIEAGLGLNIPPYMRPSDRFAGYKYPHDYPSHWVEQDYLPEDVRGRSYYSCGENKSEQAAKAYWEAIKKRGDTRLS